MKKIKAILLCMIAAAALTGSVQAGTYNYYNTQKIYVNPDDILILSTGIQVWNGYGFFPVDAIFHDGAGLYYELPQFIDPILDHWNCPNCDTYNLLDWTDCYKCGWPW
ncbi:MAG: hypothetical protein JSS60_05750 [Verrucomicrobia bacterium]|nr:hypothetical protein [Verrucomicrobiota bacterium]